MNFSELGLITPILDALQKEGYETPTPIQEQAIPHVLAGRDIFGSASTGTGKTAAFSLPMLQILSQAQPQGQRNIRGLVLAPTRELALQISESINSYGRGLNLRHTAIFGGVSQRPQTEALRRGVDILVATPGRLQDLINQGFVRLDKVEVFVLDEADRMMDMGFIHEIRKIITMLPQVHQTLLFSATLPPEMRSLVTSILTNPVHVAVAPVKAEHSQLDQLLYHIDRGNKATLLVHLLRQPEMESVLVFTRTKHGADKLTKVLRRNGVKADAIHGNKSQAARQSALNSLKARRVQALVATDVASRGIDVDFLSHVVNFDLPETPETYTHRIGRTGRAGNSGVAISFCSRDENRMLKDIERTLRQNIPTGQVPPMEALLPPLPETEGNDRDQDRDRDHRAPRNNDRGQRPGGPARTSDRPARPRGLYTPRPERTNDRPGFDRRPVQTGNDRPAPRRSETTVSAVDSETSKFFSNIGWDAPKLEKAVRQNTERPAYNRDQAPANDRPKRNRFTGGGKSFGGGDRRR